MNKRIVNFLVCLLFVQAICAQQGGVKKPPEKTDTAALQSVLDVLFATNDDCDLSVNGVAKGHVSKDSFLYVKLLPGNYQYRARSTSTGDELTDAFVVAEGSANEVFMDLLYVIDEKTAERDRIRTATFASDTANAAAKRGSKSRRTVLTKEEAQKETVNFLLSNALYMKGGSFIMGNNRSPAHDETEHSVTLNPFYFSRFEITQHQWESVMGYNPSINKGCETCPVENVSWNEAALFIRKLDSISGRKFRLPTEAEWEFVARTGGRAEVEKAGGQEAYIKKTAWYFSNAFEKAHPVGRKDPSAAGIYDLTGNVSEWCFDWYNPSFYRSERSRVNPTGPANGKEKVVRGGNFKDYVGDRFRPSFRTKRTPTTKTNELGFRVVLDASE